MAGRAATEWDVINRYLAVSVGNHRTPAWSLGPARQAAFDGVWDGLVDEVVDLPVRPVTDSNTHTACVYEVGVSGDVLAVSNVLPYVAVWTASTGGYRDSPPGWTARLLGLGLSFMGSAATRTVSPYRDAEAGRRITYFEILFEWVEGSDGPPEEELVDPWLPTVRT